ncbi:MAG: 1,4-dihydroxy-6-naphthoate synthase [bacterium]|nr:1,4-dihydroxy-6-naphthoate synthase [bacterium]
MSQLTLGFSSCPNDTYIFDALVHRRLNSPYAFVPHIHDVEELNQLARSAKLDITKASIHAYFHLLDQYQLLSSGGALGRGCGPLWIGKTEQVPKGGKVALPGDWTTANLLFQLSQEGEFEPVQMVFDQIIPAVLSGEVDSGVIIHESRFTYKDQGLHSYADLGAWWEQTSGLPIPLGGILVRRDLAKTDQQAIQALIKESIMYAEAHPQAARSFISEHAQEMGEAVVDAHIGLYVNEFSKDLGAEGRQAIERLFEAAAKKGLVEPAADGVGLFV